MSNETTPAAEPAKNESGNGDYTPPATQADLDKIISDRLSRERAKFADYEDLKAKAGRLAEIDEASKTESQKLTERAEAAERALADAQAEALRNSVLAKHSIPADYHEFVVGATEEELTAKAEKVQKLIEAQSETPTVTKHATVTAEGQTPALALNGDGIESALRNALGI